MAWRLRPRLRWALALLLAAVLPAGTCASSSKVAALEARVAAARAELREAEAALSAARADEASSLDAGAAGATCHARIWTRDPSRVGEAAAYLATQHRLRAPYYLRSARRSYEAGLRQLSGEDQTNSDPFIKQYEGLNQVVGALDLGSDDAKIWLDAGKVTVALGSLMPEESDGAQEHALSFWARACTMDPQQLPALMAWLRQGKKGVKKDELDLRKRLLKQVSKWNSTGVVPELTVRAVPSVTDGSCGLRGAPAPPLAEPEVGDEVGHVVKAFQFRTIFPTRVMSVNVAPLMPEGFVERLSELCINKYSEFGKKFGDVDPNDLNDKFFSYQVTDETALKSPQNQKRWPEMYKHSKDFKLLVKLMSRALRGFAQQSGVPDAVDEEEDYTTVLWAAVYPGNGGRHGYHVHQGSMTSCVLYLQTAGATTPITFVDPRGAQPVNDYEQHLKERDFEPVAPFHNSEYFFPEAGDLVCFPSWLVHNVPSHWEKEHRVAIAANLQGHSGLDAWLRTVASWS